MRKKYIFSWTLTTMQIEEKRGCRRLLGRRLEGGVMMWVGHWVWESVNTKSLPVWCTLRRWKYQWRTASQLRCLGQRLERFMFAHRCCAWRGAICYLGKIVNAGRQVVLLQRWALFTFYIWFLVKKGGGVLEYWSECWYGMYSCDEALEEFFSQFQFSLTSCYFFTNIFVGFQTRVPAVIRMGDKIGVGGRGRGSWNSGRYLIWCGLG